MMTSTQRSLIGFAAVVVLASTQACGGSDEPAASTPAAGAGGAHAGAAGAVGVSGGGAASAGAPAGGVGSGSGAGGATAGSGGVASGGAGGTGGSAAGAGGAAGGAAGTAGSAGSGGGSAVTFAQVAAVLSATCAGAKCHSAASTQAHLAEANGLYTLLTTGLNAPHCKGQKLVVPNNVTSSFLVQVIQGKATCMNNAGTEEIVRMPDECSTTSANPRACLTAAQIKTISDWVSAGAPQ